MHKLVRDKLPIEDAEIVSGSAYERLLREKLLEEAAEYYDDPSNEELADVVEIVETIARHRGVSLVDLHRIKGAKRARAGGLDLGRAIEVAWDRQLHKHVRIVRPTEKPNEYWIEVPATLPDGRPGYERVRADGDRLVRGRMPTAIAALTSAPRVGVAAIVECGNYVLIGKRAKDPYRGYWVLPGGGIHDGEAWRQTIRREVMEETGLVLGEGCVDAAQIPFVYEHLSEDDHRIILFVRVTIASTQTVTAASDLSEVQFVHRSTLQPWRGTYPTTPAVQAALRWAGII
jgi:ADP-ribose pyrophosphatase YjhB (NUDIX family)/predicted house-cleaning noncanonical NTP pyrophosphatase (MazG superfamily)